MRLRPGVKTRLNRDHYEHFEKAFVKYQGPHFHQKIVNDLQHGDEEQKGRALWVVGRIRYRKACAVVVEEFYKLESLMENEDDCWVDGWPAPSAYLATLGWLDCHCGHQALIVASQSKVHRVRSNAVELMSYESKWFDPELVIPFLAPEIDPVIHSDAIYTLAMKGNKETWARYRTEIEKLVHHESPYSRSAALYYIGHNAWVYGDFEETRHLLLPFLNDHAEHAYCHKTVAMATATALYDMDHYQSAD